MPKFHFRHNLGDLVSFKASRVTEDYIDDAVLTGIIVEQRYVFTADDKYRVRTGDHDFWVGAHLITLISGTKNKT